MINPNKTTSIRELGSVDISILKEKVLALSSRVWEFETEQRENDFNCFNTTQHILFRFPPDLQDRSHVVDFPIWHVWKPILMPIINQATAPYDYQHGKLCAVMLAKLLPGGTIKAHIDGSMSYYFLHKIHIPLVTNPLIDFNIGENRYYLEEGQAYEVNNIVRHEVINKSKESRIHLIFEYYDDTRS